MKNGDWYICKHGDKTWVRLLRPIYVSVLMSSQVALCRWRGEGWRLTCPSVPSAGSVQTAVATLSSLTIHHSITAWQSCAPKWRFSGVWACVYSLCSSHWSSNHNEPNYKKTRQGRDAVQSGRDEARDGVPVGLSEETHGAERIAAEEWGGGVEGDMSQTTS